MSTKAQKDAALAFVHEYAKTHYRFTGGDVLLAWRETGSPIAKINWRNTWAMIINEGRKQGWYLKVGRRPPSSRQSHTSTLALWQSRLFKPIGVQPPSPARHLAELRERVLTGKISMLEGLWGAYNYGSEVQGGE